VINRIIPFIKVLLPFWIIFLLFEFYTHFSIGADLTWMEHLQSIYFALLFATKALTLPFLLVLIIGNKLPRASYFLVLVYSSLVLVIHIALHNYAKQTGLLLGADLFGYSISEIIHTINSSNTSGSSSVFVFVLVIGIFAGLLYWFSKREVKPMWSYIYMALLVVSFISPNSPSAKDLEESTYYLIASPSNYFWTKSFSYWLSSENDI
jgi:hypothetical protein